MATKQQPVTVGLGTFYGKNAKKAKKLKASVTSWERFNYGSHQKPGSLKGI